MVIIDIKEAKNQLSRLMDLAATGEVIIITRAEKAVVRLTATESVAKEGPRQPGMFAGLVIPDSFFEPLPEHELVAWEQW